MKRILHISFIALLITGTIVLVSFTDREHRHIRYKDFQIDVLNPSDDAMITAGEINELVLKNFGEIVGSPMAAIDLNKLENTVLGNPYVSSCEVFQTIGGGLVLKARVRSPLVRIINLEDQQYYLDYNGFAMPLDFAHPSRVPIANGLITDPFVSLDRSEKPLSVFPDSSVLHQVYRVAYYISSDEFLRSFIDQIYINQVREIELVPKIGDQVILFGSGDNAREKLENLKTFYLKVMNKIDWNTYESINLKYNNQVVCTKKMKNE